jgi:hypothetical protein
MFFPPLTIKIITKIFGKVNLFFNFIAASRNLLDSKCRY